MSEMIVGPYKFIDAFAGCGGLSLGLMQAGMQGLFAIEASQDAFSTLKANLLGSRARYNFDWPDWLPKEAISIEDTLEIHNEKLVSLKGHVDVLAGGPPCQGFSMAGRRRVDDPRNKLFGAYVDLVRLLKPKIVLMENVRGFTMSFRSDEAVENYSDELKALLTSGYNVHEELLDLSQFGVPQRRTRYLLIAIRTDLGDTDPFIRLEHEKGAYLRSLNLQPPVHSWAALSDLEIAEGGTQPSRETHGFEEIIRGKPKTDYQRLMRQKSRKTTDTRLARHRDHIAARFEELIELCHEEGRLNTSVGREIREQFELKKQALRVLDPDQAAPTITSMPDDLLHYKEPRTLTVRENARLQSFPDWFEFRGKYTTGGHRRRLEVPRFTQVANAVPPLAAQAIGKMLIKLLSETDTRSDSVVTATEGAVQGSKFAA